MLYEIKIVGKNIVGISFESNIIEVFVGGNFVVGKLFKILFIVSFGSIRLNICLLVML